MNISSGKVYDVCIFGGGIAGIITALEFSKLNPDKKILIVEYGFRGQPKKNSLDESIEITNKLNHHDVYECTNKGFGGTSATWGGRCVMYDEIDFMEREVIGNNCTWELDLLSELNNYTSHAAEYFECGKPVFDLAEIPGSEDARMAEGFVEGNVTDTVVERWSRPTRFATRYYDEVKSSDNITLLEGYELRKVTSPDQTGHVQKAIIRNVKTAIEAEVNSARYVLALGTQETTRVLLRNTVLFSHLDAVPDSLGYYYQGHVSGKIASVRFSGNPKSTDFGFLKDEDGVYIRRRFQFTSDFLKKNNLLNTALWLDNPLYYDPKHRSGSMSLMYLAMVTPFLGKRLAPPAIAQSITKGKVTQIHRHLANILRDFPASLFTPSAIFWKRYFLKRKLPGVFLYSPENLYALHFHAEQIPSRSNRMYLADDGETLKIDYSLCNDDIESVIKIHESLDECLQKCKCGKLEYWFPPDRLYDEINAMSKDGIHQSGTTRIADSPEKGVVDMNLKLWGTRNVYVCSSSVFPTSSQANPTFLLGTFGVRLAKHLSSLS